MRRLAATLTILTLALPTLAQPAAVYEDDDGRVTLDNARLRAFLMETRGLDALLNLMQLELAREQAARRGVGVMPADVEDEVRRTLDDAFGGIEGVTEADYPNLLDQLLARRQLSRAEFEVIVETNAVLRNVAEPGVRAALEDEETLRRAFNARYGEQAKVRVIAAETLAELAAARERVEAGEEFAAVARDVNRDPGLLRTGGELQPFTRQSEMPDAFKQATFALDVGGVSDPVEAEGRYFLIRLEERIEPTAVKYEDVRDALREQIVAEQLDVLVPQLRSALAAELASERLKVADPVLAEQLAARLEAMRPQPTEADELKERMRRERPSTVPAE